MLDPAKLLERMLSDDEGARREVSALAARRPEAARELEELCALAQHLRSVPAPAPRPAFKAALRARLQAAEPPARTGWGLGWLWPRAAFAAGVALLLLAFLFGGVGVASAHALPGEPLYPVKRGLEQAQLALAPHEEARAGLRLGFAQERLRELQELQNRGTPALEQALAGLEEATAAATEHLERSERPAALGERLAELTERQQAVLERVAEQVPETAREALERARTASQRGHERAQEVLGAARGPAEAPGRAEGKPEGPEREPKDPQPGRGGRGR